ncbi:hypothetical protein BDM02DRAFT_3191863 [Thelephora ganbajun]|uniref:Uncharacterized protein n=1 Tax=Thelephora ganbajun TaxID=370292 RepID=A0ACB6Z1N6_THEGA|nr:hypothetical protein BDM02DRAFT_3191863 [Thelephora ganbajun]
MSLKDNKCFVSPHNQQVSHINLRTHKKDSYGLDYPPLIKLVNAVLLQEESEHPCCQFTNGCSFDDIIWQQALGEALAFLPSSLGSSYHKAPEENMTPIPVPPPSESVVSPVLPPSPPAPTPTIPPCCAPH